MTKVKLYELLWTLVSIDNEIINRSIANKSFNQVLLVNFT